jgi:hypothetical protein
MEGDYREWLSTKVDEILYLTTKVDDAMLLPNAFCHSSLIFEPLLTNGLFPFVLDFPLKDL